MRSITAADAMSERLIVMTPDVELKEAIHALVENTHSCIFVTCEEGLPIGVVTERDLSRCFASSLNAGVLPQLTLKHLMTTPLITVYASTTLDEALALARTRRVRHLAVLDDNDRLVGVLTQSSMLNAYMREIQSHNDSVSQEVQERTQELNAANQMLAALAMQDAMLGVGNRRAMEVDLKHTQAASKRYGTVYSIALIDIDFFKKYNDRYGHLAGDDALRQTAKIIQSSIRAADRIYRYGGEEFLLLLPDTESADAKIAVEQVRRAIEQANIENLDVPLGILTISAGVAQGCDTDWLASVSKADEVLYQAKESGRNKVLCAD